MSTSNNYPEKIFQTDSESTVLICTFSGWNDAGNAATDAIDYLNRALAAELSEGFDVADYYNYTLVRPHLSHDSNTPILDWPRLDIQRMNLGDQEIITLSAPEPHLNWQRFATELFAFARTEGVKRLVLLGALLDENPHTRPFPISLSSYSTELQSAGVPRQSYSGPTGITGVLAALAPREGLADLSLWVSVPHYAGHAPQPKASYELLKLLGRLLGAPINLTPLEEEKEAWERGAQELLAEEPQLARYVRELENRTEEEDVSGEDIAEAFEQYLKGRDL